MLTFKTPLFDLNYKSCIMFEFLTNMNQISNNDRFRLPMCNVRQRAFVTFRCSSLSLGSLSNNDERDDDDVKYARRDWNENVAFGGKMKLKQ